MRDEQGDISSGKDEAPAEVARGLVGGDRGSRRVRAWAAVRPNRTLRHVLLAEAGVAATANISVVVLTVFAFDVGGASLVGLAFALRFLGVGALRPVVGVAIDNLSPRTGLRVGAAVGAAGAVLSVAGGLFGAGVGVVAVIVGTCMLKLGHSVAKSGRRAAIASSAETPEQAGATISLLSFVSSALSLIGPAVASVALVAGGVVGALTISAASYLVASWLMWNLPVPTAAPMPAGSVRQVLSGQRETLRAPMVVCTFVLTGTAAFLNGATAVLYAPLVADVLSAGDAGVGILRMGFGIGGLVTSAVFVRRGATAASSRQLTAGVVLWGMTLVVLPHVGLLAFALLPMLGMGAGRTMVDSAYLTMLQRSLPESLHPRVLGLGETVNFLAGGLGALIAAPLIALTSTSVALMLLGGLTVVVATFAGTELARHRDETAAPAELVELLASTPTLAMLPSVELDLLALRVRRRQLDAGETLMVEGDPGETWFVVADGDLDVAVTDRSVATIGRGDGVGEIALLRSCPRTATVTATTPGVVFELNRSTFLRAVGLGDRTDFDDLVAARLASADAQRAR